LVGCIPTKSLLQTADVWERFVHADLEGIQCENPKLDYPKVKDRKDGIVTKHSKGVEMLLKRAKVERIGGYATLKGGGKVEVKSDSGVQTLEAKNIIVATGSEARMLPGLEPDAEFILTNIEILNLTAVPKSLAIIGAGAVGVEFASIFKRFGTDVTVIEMLPRIVPVEDEDISKELERNFRKQKIRVETGAKAETFAKDRHRREAHPHHQGRQAGRARSREAAGRRRPQAQHRKHRPGKHARSSSTAASSRWTSGSRPPSRASTPSATWSPARRSWRTWPPAKA
jgi:dihydrolipoamide dehydrogenase